MVVVALCGRQVEALCDSVSCVSLLPWLLLGPERDLREEEETDLEGRCVWLPFVMVSLYHHSRSRAWNLTS